MYTGMRIVSLVWIRLPTVLHQQGINKRCQRTDSKSLHLATTATCETASIMAQGCKQLSHPSMSPTLVFRNAKLRIRQN